MDSIAQLKRQSLVSLSSYSKKCCEILCKGDPTLVLWSPNQGHLELAAASGRAFQMCKKWLITCHSWTGCAWHHFILLVQQIQQAYAGAVPSLTFSPFNASHQLLFVPPSFKSVFVIPELCLCRETQSGVRCVSLKSISLLFPVLIRILWECWNRKTCRLLFPAILDRADSHQVSHTESCLWLSWKLSLSTHCS